MDKAMKRVSFSTLFLVCCALASGQVWCPSGATWKYDVVGFGVEGCGTAVYTNDTMLSGRAAQEIVSQESVHYYFSDTTINTIFSYFTALESGVVYQFIPASLDWDTLYWLTAPVGARWFPPGAEPDTSFCTPPGGMVEVGDTGTLVMNGLPVSYRDVHYLDMSGVPSGPAFRIYERFGSLSMGLPPGGCIISEWPYILNAYSDDAGTLYTSGDPWSCPEWLNIVEGDSRSLQAYPDPGSDQFTISLQRYDLSTLNIFDAKGQQVLQMADVSGWTIIDSSAWSQGLFFITVCDSKGNVRTLRWVKE